MNLLHILSCLALLSLLSCDQESQNSEGQKEAEAATTISDPRSESENTYAPLEGTFFDPQLDFSISQITRPHDYPSSLPDTSICEGWELSEIELQEILKGAELIDGHDWHYTFNHLSCNHRAILLQGKNEYRLSLNGGSWMTISHPDSSIMMGVYDKKFDRYFLSEPWREEDS
ncbi:MAG: hypothetical protein AAGD28_10890 [Bacteroidota bacterium]